MKIHALINDSFVDLGTIKGWAKKREHTITTTAVYRNENFPKVHDLDMLIILGGYMGAYEEEKYPWLKYEKAFIKKVIKSGKVVLGICLGAQIIAEVIGGKVFPHKHQEIGWWQVNFKKEIENIPFFKNLPQKIKVFQYHGDTYELPNEAICLAENKACKNQMFIYNDRVVGLQFHPEFNEKKLKEIASFYDENKIKSGKFVQKPEEFLGKIQNHKATNKFLYKLLDNMEEIAVEL